MPRTELRPPYQLGVLSEADVFAVAALDPSAHLGVDQIRAELRRPWSFSWVVRESGGEKPEAVVAFAMTWHVVDEVHVLNVATRVDRRRCGLAQALMNEVLRFARARQVCLVLLEVRPSNLPAIALYRALEFSVTNVRPRYYADDQDAIEMALRLDAESGRVLWRPDDVPLG